MTTIIGPPNEELRWWGILLIVLGCVILVLVIIVLIILIYRCHKYVHILASSRREVTSPNP